jgi:hypothetical protein
VTLSGQPRDQVIQQNPCLGFIWLENEANAHSEVVPQRPDTERTRRLPSLS